MKEHGGVLPVRAGSSSLLEDVNQPGSPPAAASADCAGTVKAVLDLAGALRDDTATYSKHRQQIEDREEKRRQQIEDREERRQERGFMQQLLLQMMQNQNHPQQQPPPPPP
jgi:hypothetical protein